MVSVPQNSPLESPRTPAGENPEPSPPVTGEGAKSKKKESRKRPRRFFFQSLSFKNLGVFLGVFLVALAPLATSYWNDAQENRIAILGAQLELIAGQAALVLDPEEIEPLVIREMTHTELHESVVAKLKQVQDSFQVDNLVLMRRRQNGKYTAIADGNGQFTINQPMIIFDRFSGLIETANKAWETGNPQRTGLFGLGTYEYLQLYAPIKNGKRVVALLLVNKFAEDVDQAIRMKTFGLLTMVAILALVGAAGFWVFSSRMLSPLVRLKNAALRLAAGDLDVDVPPVNRRDEVSELNESFRTMVSDLRENKKQLDDYNAQLERTLARVRLMEDLEMNLFKFVPREVSRALRTDPKALERGKTETDVTVLFLDIEGSTLLTESLEPKSIDRLIEVYFSKFLDPIYENQGDITETAGDGLMIIFQGEDHRQHAMNAIKAAVEIQA